MIEVYKHQFKDLNEVIAQVKNRNYKFIIYMDDLSFEEFEIEYKYLKAVIEGGLERKPENVLIYATSNRRHLIRETFKDKADRDEELHTNDTVQEKLSLVARFGVTIYFGSPDKKRVPGDRARAGAARRHRHAGRAAAPRSKQMGTGPRRIVRKDGAAVYRLSAGEGRVNSCFPDSLIHKCTRHHALHRERILTQQKMCSGSVREL